MYQSSVISSILIQRFYTPRLKLFKFYVNNPIKFSTIQATQSSVNMDLVFFFRVYCIYVRFVSGNIFRLNIIICYSHDEFYITVNPTLPSTRLKEMIIYLSLHPQQWHLLFCQSAYKMFVPVWLRFQFNSVQFSFNFSARD